MSRDAISPELWDLINYACDGALTPEQAQRLDELLAAEDACELFLDHLLLRTAVRLQVRSDRAVDSFYRHGASTPVVALSDDEWRNPADSSDEAWLVTPVGGGRRRRGQRLLDVLRQRPVRASLWVAGSVMAVGLLVLSLINMPNIFHQDGPPESFAAQTPVAEVTQVVGARWQSNSMFHFEGAELLPGDEVALSQGLVELTFVDGVRVLLEGPSVVTIDARKRLSLRQGKLAARVPEEGKGFSVVTHLAEFVDLGTEFGVEVHANEDVQLSVFSGSVLATLPGGEADAAPVTHELGANEGLRIDYESRQVTLEKAEPEQFVRRPPSREWKLLDVLDIVAGGDGLGRARQGGLDPATGKRAALYYEAQGTGDKTNAYHATPQEPLIDGVFVPNGAAGAVQIDSAGNVFERFPTTDALFYGPIWSRGLSEPVRLDPKGHPQPWPYRISGLERRYSPSGRGLLAMHSNCGITFDLQAIRARHPGLKLNDFIATLVNADPYSGVAPADMKTDRLAGDAFVLVDGQLRYERRRFNSTDGVAGVRVPLTDEDRFLTLATTDSSNSMRFDWILFGDPAIVMTPMEEDSPAAP